jgi:hypothetical protein
MSGSANPQLGMSLRGHPTSCPTAPFFFCTRVRGWQLTTGVSVALGCEQAAAAQSSKSNLAMFAMDRCFPQDRISWGRSLSRCVLLLEKEQIQIRVICIRARFTAGRPSERSRCCADGAIYQSPAINHRKSFDSALISGFAHNDSGRYLDAKILGACHASYMRPRSQAMQAEYFNSSKYNPHSFKHAPGFHKLQKTLDSKVRADGGIQIKTGGDLSGRPLVLLGSGLRFQSSWTGVWGNPRGR